MGEGSQRFALIEICISTSIGSNAAFDICIFFGKAHQLGSQQRQRNQIRNGHQTIEQSGNQPDCLCFHHSANHNSGCLKKCIKLLHLLSKQELGTPQTIQPPAQHRSNSEAAQSNGQHHRNPIAIHTGKCLCRQTPGYIHSIGNRNSTRENHQRCHSTQHNGIEKHFHDPHQSLLRRL